MGLLRSGRIPGFSSTGRYCTEQEEVPIERKETRPAFSLPFFTLQGFWISSRTDSLQKKG